jgi:hypothetical protein
MLRTRQCILWLRKTRISIKVHSQPPILKGFFDYEGEVRILFERVRALSVVTRKAIHRFVRRRDLTDGGEVVSLTLRLTALYSQEDIWYAFLLQGGSETETGRIK